MTENIVTCICKEVLNSWETCEVTNPHCTLCLSLQTTRVELLGPKIDACPFAIVSTQTDNVIKISAMMNAVTEISVYHDNIDRHLRY